ncbi:hypothetical protein [Ralstonia insidiosa]|uniref:Uncharacterized protein n=1 Tax=Ralstonia insidiosa TaxID=190721 RepID=A0A848NPF2_9RALS|nr:hypothetical protein [Ralstonia insidiosa]NMV36921.1 hypothetical protein [Ralstonia insidiosa]
MAVSIVKLFSPVQLGTGASIIYTAPTNPLTTVKNGRVRLTNTSGSAASVTLYTVPNGGTAGVGNECLPAVSIPGGQNLDVDFPSLGPGDTLQGLSGTASVITVSEMGGVLYS